MIEGWRELWFLRHFRVLLEIIATLFSAGLFGTLFVSAYFSEGNSGGSSFEIMISALLWSVVGGVLCAMAVAAFEGGLWLSRRWEVPHFFSALATGGSIGAAFLFCAPQWQSGMLVLGFPTPWIEFDERNGGQAHYSELVFVQNFYLTLEIAAWFALTWVLFAAAIEACRARISGYEFHQKS